VQNIRTCREHRRSMIRGAIALGLIVLLPLACCYWFFFGFTGNGCTGTTVAEIVSPTGTWKASVVDWLCESPWVTHITASVQLVSTRGPVRSADILGVDTGGHDDERPRIAWTATDVLQVTVPNRVYLKVRTLDYAGIRIDLRFDPDDIEDRTRWLQRGDFSPDGTPREPRANAPGPLRQGHK
jgi:hypothetical protein